MTTNEAPRHLNQMRAWIRNRAKVQGRKDWAVERLIANVIVGQMLPPGVVKGGTALKIRVGDRTTRFSRDLDAAREAGTDIEDYLAALDERLAAGWHGFTGTIRADRPVKAPPSVPDDYVMQPFKITLAYRGSSWLTIPFELGRDEFGSTSRAEARIAPDILELFAAIGLPAPDPIPLLAIDHQIAQKLHACTSMGANDENERAHDLVDLQILVREERPDLAVAGATARRLFTARRAQTWPPIVVAYPRWSTIYAEAAEGLEVLASVEEAVAWANNDLIARM